MARSWKDVRSEAELDEDRVAERQRDLDGRVRAYRLRQVREAQHVNQEDVASLMRVSQSRVSRIERGDIARTEVGTLRAYVEALGGQLEVVADFGDEKLLID